MQHYHKREKWTYIWVVCSCGNEMLYKSLQCPRREDAILVYQCLHKNKKEKTNREHLVSNPYYFIN